MPGAAYGHAAVVELAPGMQGVCVMDMPIEILICIVEGVGHHARDAAPLGSHRGVGKNILPSATKSAPLTSVAHKPAPDTWQPAI